MTAPLKRDMHGERACYMAGCRCQPCKTANTQYLLAINRRPTPDERHDNAIDTLLELLHS